MSLSAPVRIVATYLHKNEADLRKNLVSKSFDGLGPFANALIADGTLLETGRRRIYSRTSLEAQFTTCDTNATCTALMNTAPPGATFVLAYGIKKPIVSKNIGVSSVLPSVPPCNLVEALTTPVKRKADSPCQPCVTKKAGTPLSSPALSETPNARIINSAIVIPSNPALEASKKVRFIQHCAFSYSVADFGAYFDRRGQRNPGSAFYDDQFGTETDSTSSPSPKENHVADVILTSPVRTQPASTSFTSSQQNQHEKSSPSSIPQLASVDTKFETMPQPASADTTTRKDFDGSDTDGIQLNEPSASVDQNTQTDFTCLDITFEQQKLTHQIGINTQKADLKVKKLQLEVAKEKAKFFLQLVGSGVDEKSSSEKADAYFSF
ncbi:hypothetical protein HDU99_003731 [Rhizoclosmatium hyalinum]|nr:hypothetical protein HDU99_003731 [Rhizoclosmatium hyalinum]